MARIQLVLPDEDRDRFVHAASAEGVSLSEWLRLAARERMQRGVDRQGFRTRNDLIEFFARVDSTAESGSEPAWEEHLDTINSSRRTGFTET